MPLLNAGAVSQRQNDRESRFGCCANTPRLARRFNQPGYSTCAAAQLKGPGILYFDEALDLVKVTGKISQVITLKFRCLISRSP
jgi:hypothetical protein